MANVQKSEVLLSKANWLVESDLNFIASVIKLERGRSLGAYLMQLDYGREEITDLNNMYLEEGILKAQVMGRGFAWLDTGTHDSLLEASLFIGTLQKRQSIIIGSPEEIAYKNGWIDDEQMLKISNKYSNNQYGAYLKSLVSE